MWIRVSDDPIYRNIITEPTTIRKTLKNAMAVDDINNRITSYNVCYTKLLRLTPYNTNAVYHDVVVL